MSSLRALLAEFSPLLVLDAASSRVQVGVLKQDGSAKWETADDEAGVAVFTCIEKLGFQVGDAGAFVFCDGPGSILGIRTVAMALRTWSVLKPRTCFAYTSLALIAHAFGRPELSVMADARRDAWHHYRIGEGLRRLPTHALPTDTELVTPEGFRNWTPLPAGVQRTPYSVADLLSRVVDLDLFLPTAAPDAFLHEEPSYVTWTPQIHRAPAPKC